MKKKFALITLTTAMLVMLTACGGSSTTTTSLPSSETVTEATTENGQTETHTWGRVSVSAPPTFKLKKGDTFDENDENYFSLKVSDFKYIDFKSESADTIDKQYEYNKKTYTNEQTDVSATYGDYTWTGFQYSDGFGGYGFEAYVSNPTGINFRVSSAGYKFDDNTIKDIFSSINISTTAEDNTKVPTVEEVTTEATTE